MWGSRGHFMIPAPAQSASWLLERLDDAQRASLTQIFPAIYEDIYRVAQRYMGQERGSHTLTPTALVNEAFVRIHGRGIPVKEQTHALVLAAIAMRHILVEHARARKREKRGGGIQQIALSGDERSDRNEFEILELDDLLTQLAELDERRARVVELRFFSGMTNEEIASALGVARSTVAEDWSLARAWLGLQVRGGRSHERS